MPHQVDQLSMAQLEWLMDHQTISLATADAAPPSRENRTSISRVIAGHSSKIAAAVAATNSRQQLHTVNSTRASEMRASEMRARS
mmetsp:Transcript_17820/g.23067  ORF Transcript_17820/g.23067 Transcript_17820/m.23067 type:complete len:85 (-) Transcript_17820:247-501(-)